MLGLKLIDVSSSNHRTIYLKNDNPGPRNMYPNTKIFFTMHIKYLRKQLYRWEINSCANI